MHSSFLLRNFWVQSVSSASFIVGLGGCGSTPVLPDAKNVKVSRDEAGKSCRELGPVQGATNSVKGTVEAALEDMKQDASRKGANYVRMETTSAMGTAVSGTAYFCS